MGDYRDTYKRVGFAPVAESGWRVCLARASRNPGTGELQYSHEVYPLIGWGTFVDTAFAEDDTDHGVYVEPVWWTGDGLADYWDTFPYSDFDSARALVAPGVEPDWESLEEQARYNHGEWVADLQRKRAEAARAAHPANTRRRASEVKDGASVADETGLAPGELGAFLDHDADLRPGSHQGHV
jgi:hypothetical protein